VRELVIGRFWMISKFKPRSTGQKMRGGCREIEEKILLTEKFIERKKREYEELQMELERMREVGHG